VIFKDLVKENLTQKGSALVKSPDSEYCLGMSIGFEKGGG